MATQINTKKRHKTNKPGVFFRHSTTKGKQDKTYYIVYKNENNKTIESKVGKFSEGVRVQYAHEKYIETLNNIKLGEQPPIKRKRQKLFTFEDAFNAYIAYAKTNKKTWNKDEELYNNHLYDFHKLELVSLTQKKFDEFKTQKRRTHSDRTVQYILAVARQIINYAIDNDLVRNYTNPLSNGKVKVNVDNASNGFFTYEQANQLLEALIPYKGSTSYIYELTVLLLHTGARFSEVASLTWKDINFENKTIYFKPTKEGNQRYIAMSNSIEDILRSLPVKGSLVVSTTQGTQIGQMPKKWQKIVDALIPDNRITVKRTDENGEWKELSQEERELLKQQTKNRLTTHNLRHTHASWMAISGDFNLMEIRDELGHKSIKMTERYAHLIPAQRHDKTNRLFNSSLV